MAAALLDAEKEAGTPFVVVNGMLHRFTLKAGGYVPVFNLEKLLRRLSSALPEGEFCQFLGETFFKALAKEVEFSAPTIDNDNHLPQFWLGKYGLKRPAPYAVALANGVLRTNLLGTQAAKHAFCGKTASFFSRLPVRQYLYDPTATCPTWLAFLNQTLDAESTKTLQEWFGLCNVVDTSYQKFLCLFGPARTGKSTASNVLQRMLGERCVSNIGLDRLGSQFAGDELLGKLLNLSPDVKWVSGLAEANIKAIVGEDRISIDRKHKTSISVRLPARLMLVGNGHPQFRDTNGAILDRMLVVRFDRQIAPENRDRHLLAKLAGELPGIFNWALEGLVRLRQQGGFSVSASSASILQELARNFNPVGHYVDECLRVDPNGREFVNVVYHSYAEWAKASGYSKPLQKEQFGVELRNIVPGLTKAREGGGVRSYYYTGITLLPTGSAAAPLIVTGAKPKLPVASSPAPPPTPPPVIPPPNPELGFEAEVRAKASKQGLHDLTQEELFAFYELDSKRDRALKRGQRVLDAALAASKQPEQATPTEETEDIDEETTALIKRIQDERAKKRKPNKESK